MIFKYLPSILLVIILSCSDKDGSTIDFKSYEGEECVLKEEVMLHKNYTAKGVIFNYSGDEKLSEVMHSLELSDSNVIFDSEIYSCKIINKNDFSVDGNIFTIKRVSCVSEIKGEPDFGYEIFFSDSLGLLIVKGVGIYNHYTTFSESDLTDKLITQVLKDKQFVYPLND